MITVITPVYNGERFIESCILAVINQDCAALEHVIVDGGSCDRTSEIVRKYAESYPHIRWISEKDRGQSDAMNKGIRLARGEILNFLNVDDYYEPNVLNRVNELFAALPARSFLVGNCNVWDDNGRLKKVNRPNRLRLTDLLLGAEINPHPINPCAYFYHTALHRKIGLYNTDDHYTMDLDFVLRAASVAHMEYVNETWGNYREITGTKTVTDWASGQGARRAQLLLNSYRAQLPLFTRWRLVLLSLLLGLPTRSKRSLKIVGGRAARRMLSIIRS